MKLKQKISDITVVQTLPVETLHATSLQPTPILKNETMANISLKLGSVSTIIRSYKSAVTKHVHRLGFAMEWQERFHDHIIHDDAEYQHIMEYIRNNPMNWESDKFSNKSSNNLRIFETWHKKNK